MPGQPEFVGVTRAMRVRSVLFAGIFALVLAGAPTVHAAPQGPWIYPAIELSAAGQNASDPQIAIGPDGTETAIWRRPAGSAQVTQTATRPPGGSFDSPVNLTALGVIPQIATGADGTTVAVWRSFNGSKLTIQSATRPPGGSFGPPEDLSAADKGSDKPEIAVAPDGTATAIWQTFEGSDNTIKAATRAPGGSFGTPVDVSVPGENAQSPQIAIAPDGTATAVWNRDIGSDDIIQASTRPPGANFGTPVNLSLAGQDAFNQQIAVAPDGTTKVVWYRSDGSNLRIQAATRPPGGGFGQPVNLSAAGEDALNPQIAIGAEGTATAVWRRSNGSEFIIQAADSPPGGSFGSPVDLSFAGQDGKDPQVAVGADGTATAIWVRNDGSNDTVEAATRPAAGTFGLPVRLSAPGTFGLFPAAIPQIAIGPLGVATAVWRGSDGTNDIIQAISTAPPALALGVAKSGTGRGRVTSAPAGIDCGFVCVSTLAAYSEVTLIATPDPGSTFAGWSGACLGASGNGCELTMDETKNAVATFEAVAPPPIGEPELEIKRFMPKKPKVRRGKKVKIRVTGKNVGDAEAASTELCMTIGKKVRKALKPKGKSCQSMGTLPSGEAKTRTFGIKASRKARKGRSYRLTFNLSGDGTSAAGNSVKVRIRK